MKKTDALTSRQLEVLGLLHIEGWLFAYGRARPIQRSTLHALVVAGVAEWRSEYPELYPDAQHYIVPKPIAATDQDWDVASVVDGSDPWVEFTIDLRPDRSIVGASLLVSSAGARKMAERIASAADAAEQEVDCTAFPFAVYRCSDWQLISAHATSDEAFANAPAGFAVVRRELSIEEVTQ